MSCHLTGFCRNTYKVKVLSRPKIDLCALCSISWSKILANWHTQRILWSIALYISEQFVQWWTGEKMYIFNICEEEPTQYLIKYWKQFSHWKHLIDKNSVHVLSKRVTMLGPLDDFATFLNLPNGTIVHPSSPFQGWFVKVGDRLCERTVNLHLNMNQMSIDFQSMSIIHLERNSKSFWFVKINCQLRLSYINNT